MHSLNTLLDTTEDELTAQGSLSGGTSAILVQALIACESKPGGPYAVNEPDKGFLLNVRIQQLFYRLKKPLPAVDEYINSLILNFPDEVTERIVSILANTDKIRSYDTETQDERNSQKNISLNEIASTIQESTLVSQTVNKIYDSITRADENGEISQLSAVFSKSLIHTPGRINTSSLEMLGKANFFVWMAYSLFDKIIDNPNAATHLPAANILHRLSIHYFERASSEHSYIRDAYNRVDLANARELEYCRAKYSKRYIYLPIIPDSNLLDELLTSRGGGHILGPLLIMLERRVDKKAAKKVEEGLLLYCAARQLNDDIHDWMDDIRQGQITYVVAHLLSRAGIASQTRQSYEALIPNLQSIFWDTELEALLSTAINKIRRSKRLLVSSGLMTESSEFIRKYIIPIEDLAIKAQNTHNDKKAFLDKFSNIYPV